MGKKFQEQEGQELEGREPDEAAEPQEDGLVEVTKGGETRRVHPTTLKAHHKAGWKHK